MNTDHEIHSNSTDNRSRIIDEVVETIVHGAEIRADERRKTLEEVKEKLQNEIAFTRIQKRLMIQVLDELKGEK